MSHKRKTTVNGVELPEDFEVGSVINNVAISVDGTRYAAVTKNRKLILGDIPKDGKIEFDNMVIKYSKNSGSVSVAAKNTFGSIFTGGSISLGKHGKVTIGSNLEHSVDKGYDYVGYIHKVSFRQTSNDVELLLSKDPHEIYIWGRSNEEPMATSGVLDIEGLEGTLSMPPKFDSALELDVKTYSGDVKGDIASQGSIITSSGDVKLHLYTPLRLETRVSSGDVKVKGMISEGKGVYMPPNVKPEGTLKIETSSGDIKVKYML